VVDANVDVGSALGSTLTYTFDTTDGYYKNGAARIAWPSNFISFRSGDPEAPYFLSDAYASAWSTSDSSPQSVRYGGVTLNWIDFTSNASYRAWYGQYVYYNMDVTFSAAHPTTSVSTGMDAALSGTVLMESGSKLVLGAGSNYTRYMQVVTES
jgi:hypothetical protein